MRQEAPRRGRRAYQCPACRAWVECSRWRREFDAHIRVEHPALHHKRRLYAAELLGEAV